MRRRIQPLYIEGMKTHTVTAGRHFLTKFDSEVLEVGVFTTHETTGHQQGDLFLQFASGRCYFYPNVSTVTFVGLLFAESVGKFFNAEVRHLRNFEVTENAELIGAITDLARANGLLTDKVTA